MYKHPLVAIVGATASGKTAVSLRVAKHMDAEILSCDSMQIYRGMDIGTGKIPVSARIVPHHGFDMVSPHDPYSAALFQEYGRQTIHEIWHRNHSCLLCGGTGFYVRAVVDEFEFPKGEQIENPVREHYNQFAVMHGARALWDELHAQDPESAALIAPNDIKRVVRAFELLDDGTSYAHMRSQYTQIPEHFPCVMFGLKVDPELLKMRIEQRVDSMFREGLVQEVSSLLRAGFRDALCAQQAIGYKELIDYIEGRISLDEARDRIITATRRYAKRQRTYFKKDARIHWIEASRASVDEISKEIITQLDAMDTGYLKQ